MKDLYENFAVYYKELAEKRNHFGLQVEVLKGLFQELEIDQNDKILDAACGTGAVGNELFNSGFINISLTDGSKDMINLAKKNIHQKIPIKKHNWEKLDSYFEKSKNFNSIIIFGNSLAHVKIESLNQMFCNIYKGLKKGGYFIFDMREWMNDDTGNCIQPNNPNNSTVDLGSITINGTNFTVTGEIKYDYIKNTQIVSYVIKNSETRKIENSIFLEYSIFSLDDILPILLEAGFKNENVQIRNHNNWSYQIICCMK